MQIYSNIQNLILETGSTLNFRTKSGATRKMYLSVLSLSLLFATELSHIYLIFASYLSHICLIFASYLSQICLIFASYLPHIYLSVLSLSLIFATVLGFSLSLVSAPPLISLLPCLPPNSPPPSCIFTITTILYYLSKLF